MENGAVDIQNINIYPNIDEGIHHFLEWRTQIKVTIGHLLPPSAASSDAERVAAVAGCSDKFTEVCGKWGCSLHTKFSSLASSHQFTQEDNMHTIISQHPLLFLTKAWCQSPPLATKHKNNAGARMKVSTETNSLSSQSFIIKAHLHRYSARVYSDTEVMRLSEVIFYSYTYISCSCFLCWIWFLWGEHYKHLLF